LSRYQDTWQYGSCTDRNLDHPRNYYIWQCRITSLAFLILFLPVTAHICFCWTNTDLSVCTGENTLISEHYWLLQQVCHSPSKQILALFLKIDQTISFCALPNTNMCSWQGVVKEIVLWKRTDNTIKLWELPCAAEDQLCVGMDVLCSKEQWFFCEHFWKLWIVEAMQQLWLAVVFGRYDCGVSFQQCFCPRMKISNYQMC
jgi:hypothetical protein